MASDSTCPVSSAITGVVLVLVAAGLVVNALHTAHEAGWLDIGQGRTVDLSWLVRPGTVQASLLTGMLGLQPTPTVIEVVGWLAYLIPVAVFIAWPPGRRMAPAVRDARAAVSRPACSPWPRCCAGWPDRCRPAFRWSPTPVTSARR